MVVGGLPVNEVPDCDPRQKPADYGQREGGRWKPKANSSNEDDRFEAFTEDRNERQDEECVSLAEELEPTSVTQSLSSMLLL